MKVFGVGLNKTGTTTLGQVMAELGFHNYSYDLRLLEAASEGDLEPVFEVADKYESFEDWPWPLLYEKLDKRYDRSKFILTKRRSEEEWIDSLKRHANRTGPTKARQIVYGHAMPHGHEKEHINIYKKHNYKVKKYFGKRNDIIEVCWGRGDSWQKVCRFMGVPVPDKKFPHANRNPGKLYSLFQRSINVLKRKIRKI